MQVPKLLAAERERLSSCRVVRFPWIDGLCAERRDRSWRPAAAERGQRGFGEKIRLGSTRSPVRRPSVREWRTSGNQLGERRFQLPIRAVPPAAMCESWFKVSASCTMAIGVAGAFAARLLARGAGTDCEQPYSNDEQA